ncbi:hypothetical protein GWI33_020485 [Rhynchophorus ferrugineus]|uniref:Uncharacterized protein n=1 Tax=Rhynchophorus ferrugineus TaxID=354439 RepID=A0A834M3D5_RHYFE|nr:hypothetical protein GWI33_020485 [Rhynchophorus ferrugineus]
MSPPSKLRKASFFKLFLGRLAPETHSVSKCVIHRAENMMNTFKGPVANTGIKLAESSNFMGPALFTEIAMLLPGSLSQSRIANTTSDIRKNLRVRDPSENPQYDPKKT